MSDGMITAEQYEQIIEDLRNLYEAKIEELCDVIEELRNPHPYVGVF